MSEESYSIYCISESWDHVLVKVNEMPNWTCNTQSGRHLQVTTPDGDIRISGLLPEIGGKFGPVYVGVINRARRIATDQISLRDSLVQSLKSTNMIIGCVMHPEMIDDDTRFNLILSLAEVLNGVVFDTFTFISSKGEVILSLDGTH